MAKAGESGNEVAEVQAPAKLSLRPATRGSRSDSAQVLSIEYRETGYTFVSTVRGGTVER